MISGMYIGEVTRLALLKRANTGSVFNGSVPAVLQQENSLDGAVVSDCITFVFKRFCKIILQTSSVVTQIIGSCISLPTLFL